MEGDDIVHKRDLRMAFQALPVARAFLVTAPLFLSFTMIAEVRVRLGQRKLPQSMQDIEILSAEKRLDGCL